MAVGNLVYTKGLKGTQPLYISEGNNSAVAVGDMEVPKLKTGGILLGEGSNSTLKFTNYPTALLLRPNAFVLGCNNDMGDSFVQMTTGSVITKVGSIRSHSGGGKLKGNYFHIATEDETYKIVTPRSNDTDNNISNIELRYQLKSWSDAINYSSGNLSVRYSTSDLSDISDFGTFGSEYTSAQYSDISTKDSNYVQHNSNGTDESYVVFKYDGLSKDYQYLIPLFNNRYLISNVASTPGGTISFSIWNFNKSSWNSLSEISVARPNYGSSGNAVGDIENASFGPKPVLQEDYVNASGECYIKHHQARIGDGTARTNIGYVELREVNMYNDNVNSLI